MADDPSASLEEAKRIADGLQFACRLPDRKPDFFACGGPAAEAYWDYFTPARVISLVAALEAALKLADDWKREAVKLEPSGADAVQPAMPGNYLVSGRIGALEECEGELREAITRTLNGAGDDSGR